MPRPVRFGIRGLWRQAQCLGMMTFSELPSVPSDHPVLSPDQLRLAVAAYLARFKGASRYHTESDLLLPGLVRRARPGPAGRAPPAP